MQGKGAGLVMYTYRHNCVIANVFKMFKGYPYVFKCVHIRHVFYSHYNLNVSYAPSTPFYVVMSIQCGEGVDFLCLYNPYQLKHQISRDMQGIH